MSSALDRFPTALSLPKSIPISPLINSAFDRLSYPIDSSIGSRAILAIDRQSKKKTKKTKRAVAYLSFLEAEVGGRDGNGLRVADDDGNDQDGEYDDRLRVHTAAAAVWRVRVDERLPLELPINAQWRSLSPDR